MDYLNYINDMNYFYPNIDDYNPNEKPKNADCI